MATLRQIAGGGIYTVRDNPVWMNGAWLCGDRAFIDPNCDQYEVASLNDPALDPAVIAKVEQLWKAADAYTSNFISGLAIGLLTIGVLRVLPKAMAVEAWSSSIWTEYYARKAAVTADSALNLDFSSFGPMPHTVPELRAELGM